MTEEIIKNIKLSNGLLLSVTDASRRVATDLWQVRMIARMDIPVSSEPPALKDADPDAYRDFQESVGKKVCFEQQQVRNFVDTKNKEQALQNLIASFHKSSMGYLSHPDFPSKFAMRKFKEYLKRKSRSYQ